jgi:hypothetical protein
MGYYDLNAPAKGDDRKLSVRFYKRTVQKKFQKNQKHPGLQEKDLEWRNVDTDYVEIKMPGDRLQVYDQAAKQEHKERFAYQWDKYQQRLDQNPTGTPLYTCNVLNEADVRMLETRGFITIEQIVNMDDQQAQKFHAGYTIKKRVSDWYDAYVEQASSGRVSELEAKIAKLEEQLNGKPEVPVETTEALVRRLMEEHNQVPHIMQEKKKRGPGRPRKDAIKEEAA